MQRFTNQKQIILEFLRKDKSHPTADNVFSAAQKKLPRISKATVYRILDGFVKEDLIKNIEGKKTRFDGNKKNHQHFICNTCGDIIDIYDKKIEEYLNIKKNIVQNSRVESFDLNFRGQCKKCKN